jgi:hypothetical protein
VRSQRDELEGDTASPSIRRNKSPAKRAVNAAKSSSKEDALELAHLIYDLYKEQKANATLINGQNNANQPNSI